MQEELEVIEQKKHKEKEAFFNQKFIPYLQQMYNYAFYLTKDEDDANDLVQDTYIKAFRFMNSFQIGTNEKAWLFKIMKNGFINDYRRKTNKPVHYSFDTVYEQGESDDRDELNELPQHAQSQSTDLYKGLIGDEVMLALESLTYDYKQIILLADLEEFSYEELSEILDIPIGTVRSRLFRARNLLKEKLRNYGKNLGYKEKR